MAFGKRYTGTFYSTAGKKIQVDIMQDGYTGSTGDLDFTGDEPLVIEWDETAKEDVICGSTATLGIISPGDRTYIDLYTIAAGKIRMDVYVDDSLYWSGALDPEFYEEPYAYTEDYELSITFSDFGILDRLKWNKSGMQTLYQIITDAISQTVINCTAINEDYISTQLNATSGKMDLSELCVRSDNFYDEDGESKTLREVIEGILQPLGCRMIQKGGKIWIYDLNGLYTSGPSMPITWMDTEQMLGVDKVANDIKITFSPYASSEQLSGSSSSSSDSKSSGLAYKGESDPSMVNVTEEKSEPGYQTYFDTYENSKGKNLQGAFGTDWANKVTTIDEQSLSFTIFTSNIGSGIAEKSDIFRYFKILPILGAEEAEGIAWGFYSGGNAKSIGDDLASGNPEVRINNPAYAYNDGKTMPTTSPTNLTVPMVMKLNPIYLPTLSEDDRKEFYIRITMDMLMDPRYNPFVEAGEFNEQENYNIIKMLYNQVYVYANVYMTHDDGTYSGFDNTGGKKDSQTIYDINIGEWKSGMQVNKCELAYYDKTDIAHGCGILGWKANRHNIGSRDSVPKNMQNLDDGQYIPYPEKGGYLNIIICGSYRAVYTDMIVSGLFPSGANLSASATRLRWLLYKSPTVEIVRADATKSAAESEDIEYKGTINALAKDDIELDTICGTMKKTMPTAKGCYYKSGDRQQLSTLYRSGRTNQVERLLIGTMCSQYASRHTKLSGITKVLTDDLTLYTDASQPGKRYICLADSEDLAIDESDMSIVELSGDGYDPQ